MRSFFCQHHATTPEPASLLEEERTTSPYSCYINKSRLLLCQQDFAFCFSITPFAHRGCLYAFLEASLPDFCLMPYSRTCPSFPEQTVL